MQINSQYSPMLSAKNWLSLDTWRIVGGSSKSQKTGKKCTSLIGSNGADKPVRISTDSGSCSMHRRDFWYLAKVLVVVLFVLALLSLCSCKSGGGLFGVFHSGPPAPPKPTTAGAGATFAMLKSISWAFVVPGAVLFGISFWGPASFLRNLGGTFLVIGGAAAITPWLLERFAEPAFYTVLGLAVLYGLWWLYDYLWNYKRRRAMIFNSYVAATTEEDRQKHLGAIAVLDRMYSPYINGLFKKNKTDALLNAERPGQKVELLGAPEPPP